jgi:hypothetical protein
MDLSFSCVPEALFDKLTFSFGVHDVSALVRDFPGVAAVFSASGDINWLVVVHAMLTPDTLFLLLGVFSEGRVDVDVSAGEPVLSDSMYQEGWIGVTTFCGVDFHEVQLDSAGDFAAPAVNNFFLELLPGVLLDQVRDF